MIDSHCHVDMYRDPSAAAREIERRRIETVAVTNLPSHYQLGMPHIQQFNYIHLALGMHPLYARLHGAELALFDKLVVDADYIGEIGLDLSREGVETREMQVATFDHILAKIVHRQRFVTLHSRGAEKEVLHMLTQHKMYNVVFHWYSGELATLKQAIDEGHFFSVNTAMLSSERGRRLVAHIPKDQLLTESDGPHVRVNGKAANPKHISLAVETIALLWNLSSEEVEAQIAKNFSTLHQKHTS